MMEETAAAGRQKPPMFASDDDGGLSLMDGYDGQIAYEEKMEEEGEINDENGHKIGDSPDDRNDLFENSVISSEFDMTESSILTPKDPNYSLNLTTSRRTSFSRRSTEVEHSHGYTHRSEKDQGASSVTQILSRRGSSPLVTLASSTNNVIHRKKEKEELERMKAEEATAEKDRIRNLHIKLMRDRRREGEHRLAAIEQVCNVIITANSYYHRDFLSHLYRIWSISA